jgi:signal transduction histidine kinase
MGKRGITKLKLLLSILVLTFCLSSNSYAQDKISKTKINPTWVAPEQIFAKKDTTLSREDKAIIDSNKSFLTKGKEYDNMSTNKLKDISSDMEKDIKNLNLQKQRLINRHASREAILHIDMSLNYLKEERRIISLYIIKNKLSDQTGLLLSDRQKLRNELIASIVGISILILVVLALFQRYRIKSQDGELLEQMKSLNKKNIYLEYAAKIIRHDMHSGINTYMPRGINSLERRLTPENIASLKIESPMKMIKEGLIHTQKVYKGVYEFTNLVKKDSVLSKEPCDLKKILLDYLSNTSYISQVSVDMDITIDVNQSLFCTALDNLIRNGLKYNDSDSKKVSIFMEKNYLVVQDNGRGMTQDEFKQLSQPFVRKEGQKESGSGLGLNICVAILEEHGFIMTCEKNKIGTKIKIKIK